MENPTLAAMCQVAEDLMRRMGMNVQLVAMDFATMAQRRTSKEPIDKGGWSLFVTVWTGSDIVNPAVHQMLRAGGPTAWFGWPNDPEMEALRDQWANAATAEEQKKLAIELAGTSLQDAALHPARVPCVDGGLSQEPDRRLPLSSGGLLEYRQELMR